MSRRSVAQIRSRRRSVAQADLVITGVEELDAQLRRLQRSDALKIGRRAITIGLRIQRRAIQSEIRPKVINRLTKGRKVKRKGGRGFTRVGRKFIRKLKKRTSARRAIGSKFRRNTVQGRIEAKTGVNVGKRKSWWTTFATGTKPRYRKRIGGFHGKRFKKKKPTDQQLSTGQIIGDDFVGRGARKSERSVRRAIQGIVTHGIETYWKNR